MRRNEWSPSPECADVLIATGRAQQPYVYGTLGGEPVFLRP